MRKILLCALTVLVSACAPQDPNNDLFDTTLPPPPVVPSRPFAIVPTPPVAEPVPQETTQKIFAANKTYMADQANRLREAASTSGVIIKQEGPEIVIVMPDNIVFGSNQLAVDTQFEPVLAAMARIIKEYDTTRIQVLGYTDNVGTVADNVAFSLKQANSVANFLRLNGVDINRIVVDGLGPQNPVASNTTLAGRQKNQRVEITLTNVQ